MSLETIIGLAAATILLGGALMLFALVVWAERLSDRQHDEELQAAIDRLEMEEKRFRVGNIDRRNLAQ